MHLGLWLSVLPLASLSPLINKPAVAFPPPPSSPLPILSFNSSFLTNPSFQERGSCSVLGMCQWSGVCWLHQWLSLSGDNGIAAPRGRVLHAEFPCLIHSCALAPSQQRKGTKLPGRLWQAVPLSAGQKLIPSSSPVPPTEGAGLASLAFCVSLSGGVKGREQMSRGWSIIHVAPQTDGWTDAVLLYEILSPTHAKTQHRFRGMHRRTKVHMGWYPAHNVQS